MDYILFMKTWGVLLILFSAIMYFIRSSIIDATLEQYYRGENTIYSGFMPLVYGQHTFRVRSFAAGINPLGIEYNVIPLLLVMGAGFTMHHAPWSNGYIHLFQAVSITGLTALCLFIHSIRLRLRYMIKPEFLGPFIMISNASHRHWLETGRSLAMLDSFVGFLVGCLLLIVALLG